MPSSGSTSGPFMFPSQACATQEDQTDAALLVRENRPAKLSGWAQFPSSSPARCSTIHSRRSRETREAGRTRAMLWLSVTHWH